MDELQKILGIKVETTKKQTLRAYEDAKRICEADDLGIHCAQCSRYGKPTCFDKTKAKKEGWKWKR